jgi:hypothetical protein
VDPFGSIFELVHAIQNAAVGSSAASPSLHQHHRSAGSGGDFPIIRDVDDEDEEDEDEEEILREERLAGQIGGAHGSRMRKEQQQQQRKTLRREEVEEDDAVIVEHTQSSSEESAASTPRDRNRVPLPLPLPRVTLVVPKLQRRSSAYPLMSLMTRLPTLLVRLPLERSSRNSGLQRSSGASSRPCSRRAPRSQHQQQNRRRIQRIS